MRVLIVGGGGREHALAWKIAQSPLCEKLYCAPGNPGIEAVAESVTIAPGEGFAPLVEWCRAHGIGLVVVGPERPLSEGIVDALQAVGIKAFGPTARAAQLEASKRFAKELMREAGIPTALELKSDGTASVSHAIGGLPLPEGASEVFAVDVVGDGLRVTLNDGQSRDYPFDAGFLGIA